MSAVLRSIEEAWEAMIPQIDPMAAETVPLNQAGGRCLAAAIAAPMDLPPFDNSAMDGYALRAADTLDAAADSPVALPVHDEIIAGAWSAQPVAAGTAVKIMTGAALPPAADAVLMLEAGRLRRGAVEIREPVEPGRHVRRRGEDVRQGEALLPAGAHLNAQSLGLLASCGIAAVQAHRMPRVSLLATGSELAVPGQALAPGQIYDSNRIVLRRLLAIAGIAWRDYGVVPDDALTITERIREALAAEVLLISGGVSVGSHDYVKAALEDCGVTTVFWRVNMKPGKPLFCGRSSHGWVFGLPGNPISCVIGMLVFVEPLLRRLQGETAAQPRYVKAHLTQPVRKHDARRWFLTARLTQDAQGRWEVTPTAQQGSAMMRALAAADGFLVVPERCETLARGALADVLLMPEKASCA